MYTTYKPHELALLLPALQPTEYEHLKQSIARDGLDEPITLYNGEILDGVHRERICNELGIDPDYRDYEGDDPARFIFGKNLGRRHLTTGQKAMIGAQLEEHFAKEARKRMTSSGRRGGMSKGKADRPTPSSPRQARDDAAKVVGTSGRSISRAKRVLLKRPDLAEKIKSGDMAVNAADEEIRTGRSMGNGNEGEAAKPQGKSKNWNGKSNAKRGRELKDRKRDGNFNDLLSLQIEMNKLCVVLEDYEPDDFELNIATLGLIDDFYEDLISLDIWCNRALMATQGWLDTVKIREKIAKLRDVTGRDPYEAELFLKEADRLERKLEKMIEEGTLT